jgi:hypothetical protein
MLRTARPAGMPLKGFLLQLAADLFLFALPNQNADSTPERIWITDVGSFYEPLVAVQMVVMQLAFSVRIGRVKTS